MKRTHLSDPAVSVIIPCYNSASTIGETLGSLQKQVFPHWEAIVVNDGSTDGSAEIIRQYRTHDSRIRQIDQENQGLPGARNTGLSAAKGKYVNFLDADDLLMPHMLKRMVMKLNGDTMLGAVHCGTILGDPELQDLSWSKSFQGEGQIFEILAHTNPFPCHTILIRRDILENAGLFDCSLRHCHDWDLWLRVARAGTYFGRVPESLVIYRMMPVSLSRNPQTFFRARKEVIFRGHGMDPRVKNATTQFLQGCECSMKEAILKNLIGCVAIAIAQGNAVQASELLETTFEEESFHLTPVHVKSIIDALWLGAAVPKGNWITLWPRIRRPLLKFLLRQEERLESPGFSMQCILESIDWRKFPGIYAPEKMPSHELLSALQKKIMYSISHYLNWGKTARRRNEGGS